MPIYRFFHKFIIIVFAVFTLSLTYAQPAPDNPDKKLTISGYVRDIATGEELIGATVFVNELNNGAATNMYGFYSISLIPGTYNLVYSYIGYKSYEKKIILNKNIHLNIELNSAAFETEEVEVTAQRKDKNIKSTEVGKIELEMEIVKSIPAILGETDILKTIQLLPGVQSAGEGNSGFYVRGGGADQNLILLDEAVVYNTGHLFGFFSVFNSDAIKNTTLIKGGMPANYGGRLSSVVDVSMKDGNSKGYHASGGIGVISSKLTIEGPIIKDKSSFMVSARRTYGDWLAQPFLKEEFKGNAYHFFDLNTKLNYRFSDKDRIYLSGYFGRDMFTFQSKESDFKMTIPWGNATTTFRWNHLFSDKLFLNTSLIYNDYNFKFDMKADDISMLFYSGIKDINAKLDFGYFPGLLHKIKFGANYIYHTFTPSSGTATFGDDFDLDADNIKKKYAHEIAFYATDEFDITEWLRIEAGLRYSIFTLAPPYDQLITNNKNQPTDTLYYRQGDKVATYGGFEPRINMRIELTDKSSLKASYIRTLQYIHLVSNANSTLPTDVWVPSSKIVKPQIGDQYSIGYFRNFLENKIETSVELYYKKMDNQIEYRDGYIETLDRELEWDFVFGEGESYGIELFINKTMGKTTGWIGYTLSKTTRHFEDLITQDFPAKYDRTHDLSVVVIHQLNEKITFGATFVYGTGVATTLPGNFYMVENNIISEYMPRNSYRLEPYHRLDVSATIKGKKHERYESEWVFAVYNVYNHKNIYFIYFETDGDIVNGDISNKAYKVTLFPIIPSISWNFKF